MAKLSRRCVKEFFNEICNLISVKGRKTCFAPKETVLSRQNNINAIRFFKEGSLTANVLADQGRVFLNVFVSKPFDSQQITDFSIKWFSGKIMNYVVTARR